jgi:RNA polymerase sigma factor (sigma-70 family)
MNTTDGELLRRYSSEQNDPAFKQLVERYIDLVYSAALRQVNGDAHLAEDVAQSVFTDVARKAVGLTHHTSLLGWLYTSTRFAASSVRRQEQRRRVREQEAYSMNSILTARDPEPDWQEIRPLLDEAMHTLGDDDREAVLLRHFERRSFAEIGERLQLSENAARMKVDRALQKLHSALEKRGVTSTAIALATLMTTHAVCAAPASLAMKVGKGALAAATAGGISLSVAKLLALAKAPIAIAAIAIATTAVVFFASSRRHATETSAIRAAVAATTLTPSNATPTLGNKTVTDGANVSTSQTSRGQSVLHLTLLTKQTGEPVSTVTVDYRGWSGKKFKKQTFTTDRVGNSDVTFPTNTTQMELTTRFEGLADTRLLWAPKDGDVIPGEYVLKLDPAVPIGGQVLDPDGNPVAGAKVGWNHQDDPAGPQRPESHEFGWIEVTTGADGRWRVNRVGRDMIRRLYGSARHTNYVDTFLSFAGRDQDVAQKLTNQTYVFQLGRAVVARGVVVDPSGKPVSDAKVIVGEINVSGHREGITASDGSFSVAGCRHGKELVTAQAPGFASTTVETELADNSEPVRITLQPGRVLRLRVVSGDGRPVSKASIWYNNLHRDSVQAAPPQADIRLTTGEDGRASLTNAPAGQLNLRVTAQGFGHFLEGVTISADDEEHVLTLSPQLMVSGRVRDAKSGELIPHFRIIEGYPSWNPRDNSTNPIWGVFERFTHDFSNGTFHQSFSEPVISGQKNPGYFLKFTADGYAPFVSRMIAADEGTVQLDVALRPAKEVVVTVLKPDGGVAVAADVGLVEANARLSLAGAGFERRNIQSGGTLLMTDGDGQFKLPEDDAILRVIVASPDGYAESTRAALPTNNVMQLQPWGSLDVTCVAAGKPIVGRDYMVEFGGGAMETVSFDFERSRVKTDEQGHFSVETLPPGKHKLLRIYPFKTERGNGYRHGDKIEFEIRPGETTQLNPSASEHTVFGRWQWASGAKVVPQSMMFAGLRSGSVPIIPPEMRKDRAAIQAFVSTPEFRAAQEKMRSYTATVGDGTLQVEGVQPGKYELTLTAFEPGKSTYVSPETRLPMDSRPVASGSITVDVPSDGSVDSVDAGVVEVRPIP